MRETCDSVAKILDGLKLPEPAGDDAPAQPPRAAKQAALDVSRRVDRTIAPTSQRLADELRIDLLLGPLDAPVRKEVEDLCDEAAQELDVQAGRLGFRAAAISLFGKIVAEFPGRVDLLLDDHLDAFLNRVPAVLGDELTEALDPAAANGDAALLRRGTGRPGTVHARRPGAGAAARR